MSENPMSPESTARMSHVGAALCDSTNRAGELCGAAAIRGLTKCRHHAGTDLATARIRGLQALGTIVPTATDRLAGIIDNPGTGDADAIRAIKVVFDTALDSRSVGEVEKIESEQLDKLKEVLKELFERLDLTPEERIEHGHWIDEQLAALEQD